MVRPLAYHQHHHHQHHQQQNMQGQYHDDDDDDDDDVDDGQHHLHDVPEVPSACPGPADLSDSTMSSSSGCSSAPGSTSDPASPCRPPDVVSSQPGPVLPSTQPGGGTSSPACCGCAAPSDGDRSTPGLLHGDRSVSRGVGYCCTVQPIDRTPQSGAGSTVGPQSPPVTIAAATTPQPGAWSTVGPQSPPVTIAAATTPEPGAWPSVDVQASCRDELLLNARHPASTTGRRRSARPQPPPLPPPRRTSLKTELN